MVVAHNPGIHDLTLALAEQAGDERLTSRIQEGFPTGAMAVFGFDGEMVTALGLFFPRDHGGGGGFD